MALSTGRRLRAAAGVLALTAALGGLAAPASAQQGEPGVIRLETVQVTSQKRVENLQDVPIAITVFEEDDIFELDLANLEDVARYAPGVFVSRSPLDPTDLRIQVRGIGNADPQIGLDSKTAIYVDGVYIGKTRGLIYDLDSLERIEVLRGPQGTLYGRNAVAGAVNFITRRADVDGYSASVSAQAGEFDFVEARGRVNVPVTDEWAFAVHGLYNEQAGWVENNGLGEDWNGFQNTAFGFDTTYAPTDFLEFHYRFDYNDKETTPPFWQPIGGPNDGPFSVALPAYGDERQESGTATLPIQPSDLEASSHNLQLDWKYAANHSLRGTLGYRAADTETFIAAFPELDVDIVNGVLRAPSADLGGQSLAGLYGPSLNAVTSLAGQPLRADYLDIWQNRFQSLGASSPRRKNSLDDHQQWQAELTFTGAFGPHWDYTAGLFYFDENTGSETFGNEQGLNGIFSLFELNNLDDNMNGQSDFFEALGQLQAAGQLGCFGAAPDPSCAGLLPLLQANAEATTLRVGELRDVAAGFFRTDTQAYAAYGQATYSPWDDWRFTVGARLSVDEKDAVQQGGAPFLGDTVNLLGDPIPRLRGSETFASFDPTATVEHDISDTVMVYAKYAEGFRSGGFNAVAIDDAAFTFDKEEIYSVEAGLRSELFDGRARLNVNVYMHVLDGEQVLIQPPGNIFARAIVNTDSEYSGIELDGSVLLSEHLTANFSYAFADSDLDPLFNPFSLMEEARDEVGLPENSWWVNLEGDYPTRFGRLKGRIDYSHQDETFVLPHQPRSEEDLVSARLAAVFDRPDGSQVEVALWGRNLLDDEYTVNFGDLANVASDIQVFGQPRTFGVQVKATF